jgi:flagellar biosynthesis/type III secretory pathway protein FliH
LQDLEAPEFDKILVATEDEEVRTMTTTMVEWWKKKGLEEGLEQGLEQGMEQGMEKGRKQGMQQGGASLLKRLLLNRFDQLPQWIDQRLENASRQELEGWADRVLDAQRLEDVFSSI